MKKILLCFMLVISFFSVSLTGIANNIRISNVSVLPGSNQIQFDLAWDNSWRSDVLQNWDAAWVFMKYRDVDGSWKHLAFTNSNNTAPAGYTLIVASDNNGAFLYRSLAGNGNNTITGIKLGIPSQHALGVYDIKVFGIEMVYIPTGAFWAGDNGVSANSYIVQNSTTPVLVDQNITGIYDPLAGGAVPLNDFSSSLNPSYIPTGYNGFYCMKYEITQGAYRDFLNTLTYSQQVSRTSVAPSSSIGTIALMGSESSRAYIHIATPGLNIGVNAAAVYGCDANNNNVFNEAADGEWVACNYLSWPDLTAYLNWACLAPMSELQYEKICRGPLQPVSGEFPWGTNLASNNIYLMTNTGAANESISNPSGTANEGNSINLITDALIAGPVRNGIFATASSDRITSGGAFYGVMEMGGNMWERVISTATLKGRSYRGVNGTGQISASGNAVAHYSWPGTVFCLFCETGEINGSVNADGLMYRGGSSHWGTSYMRTSDRSILESGAGTVRYIDQGGRGVRNL